MPMTNPGSDGLFGWRGKALLRVALLLLAAAAVAGIASSFGIARDYGYLRASILTGSTGGEYFALGTRLAARADRERGRLTVVPTAGSVENVNRLVASEEECGDMFALIQDGTPVPAEAQFEVLGRLPEPESLLLLTRPGRAFHELADLRGAAIGIGPEGSGTAYLMKELFSDQDLRALGVRLSQHGLKEQARLVAEGKLDLAAFVMKDDSDFLRDIIREHGLDIAAPQDLQGLIARYPWLSLGHIPAGRFDLVRQTPPTDKLVARVATLVVASPCAQRADRIALLMLLSAELPGFLRSNPPSSLSSATSMALAPEAQQFFLTGKPEIADRYFPWLVNLMSPAYWVYLVMAATVLFNGMTGYSRFRLWRIDATREKLEAAFRTLVGPDFTRAEMRALPDGLALTERETPAARGLLDRLTELRSRCQRQASSIATPMGDEMFYRYQQSLIDEAIAAIAALLRRSSGK